MATDRLDAFTAIIDKAARELREAFQREPWGSFYLWALPTTPDRDGSVIVAGETCPEPGARCVRPCDGGGTTFTRWAAVPYGGYHSVIRSALRREPILPRA